jgi:hypothetical protein
LLRRSPGALRLHSHGVRACVLVRQMLVRLSSSRTFSIEGTGLWHRESAPIFICSGLNLPVAVPSCTSLQTTTKIASLWETGYMAHLVIGSWQAGGEIHLQLNPDNTRNVYLERVEVRACVLLRRARGHVGGTSG